MALSGSLSKTNSYITTTANGTERRGNWTTQLSWSGKQSYGGNYTDITCNATITCYLANGFSFNTTSGSWKLNIDGEQYTSTTAIPTAAGNTAVVFSNITKRVYHESDGYRSITISLVGDSTSTWGMVDVDLAKTWVLNQIPRYGQITAADDFNDEENPIISYNCYSTQSITSLEAAISLTGEEPDIAYRAIPITDSGSYTFELTEAERNILRAATIGSNSRKVRFYIRTILNGDYYFSYKEKTFTVINAEPQLDIAVFDINATTTALTGDNSTLIRFYSTAYASMNAIPKKQATITSHEIEHNTNIFTTLTQTFNKVEGNIFSFRATDSRGNSVEDYIQSPMIDYTKLTCNYTGEKMDALGTMAVKCSGNFFNDTFGYTSAAVMNTLTVQYRYKPQGGSYGSWNTMNATKSGNTYEATASVSGLDYQQTYIFQCRAVDKLLTVESAEITIKSMPIFHWSEDDFTFEVPVIFNAGAEGITGGSTGSTSDLSTGGTIDGDLTITGNLRLKGSGNYGNTFYFGDGSYANISEPTDDTLTIKASNINLNGNVLVNGSAIGGGSATAGTWTPYLNSSAISSYTTRQGWYSKVGNVITIGFFIKANCNSGHQSTAISISGLPYTPSYAVCGGGMCSGAYVSGGFNFQCWNADTSGNITARVQQSNNTAATNLSTSASGCFYRSNGGEITLSGTICYTI